MNKEIIDKIDRIIAASGCSSWEIEHETTLYVEGKDYDCITYYRGGYGYPEMCFVKEKLMGNNYGALTERVDYAEPEEFLAVLETQSYIGGMWRKDYV